MGRFLRGSARNFAKIARPARENFEFWHRVRARFCKKGGHWVPNSKTRGHQVLEGTKKGVIGYRTDQKRGSIDRHMTRTHILECPPRAMYTANPELSQAWHGGKRLLST